MKILVIANFVYWGTGTVDLQERVGGEVKEPLSGVLGKKQFIVVSFQSDLLGCTGS